MSIVGPYSTWPVFNYAVQAAVYRAETKLAELRSRYETECSRIRTAMLCGVEVGGV
jgi:hypothetical protein